MHKLAFQVILLWFVSMNVSKVFAQQTSLADWSVLSDEKGKPVLADTVFMDKRCVKVDGKSISAIWNKHINLKNFRVELDIAGAVMSGIGFHTSDEQNYQFLYFRPGYGGTIEAIQYIPIYNGALSWVFYGAYQAAADIHGMQWFHAAIEVRGNNLKVFTNGSNKPDMDIMLQHTGAERGSLLLRSMFGTSYFANLNYRELPEAITDWEISEQLPAATFYGNEQVKNIKQWKKINEPNDDYVNLCRYFKLPEGTVIARHILTAAKDESRYLSFDFTGTLHILLNGKEVFAYDKQKLERVELDKYRIRLPVLKGSNELVFITQGDGFIFGKGYNSMGRLQHQNWGFIAGINN